jgi:hypothetical protein
MPSPENKLLQIWFAPILKSTGFKKTGATWHRLKPPFTHVFNIQGSQWSRYFYFNLGIYITDLGTLERPSEADCHIRERLDGIVPDRKRFIQISDLEQNIPEQQRQSELQAIISSFAIPWLDRMNSKNQLRHYILNEKKHGLPVTVSTYEYLGIPKV